MFLLNPNSSNINVNGVLVQSGAVSRIFVAEKNCSTFLDFVASFKNELLTKAGFSPQPNHFF
jgi:hypothetical protein